MATEYGGTYGDQPRLGGQPSYWDLSAHGAPPEPRRRAGAGVAIGVTAVVLGAAGLVVSLFGVAAQLLPRQFSAGQQRQITNWEYGKRWRELPAGRIFPASVRYAPPAALSDDPSLGLLARRVGIARQATCRAAADAAAAAVLDRDGCLAMLRATYLDETNSYVVTVGAAIMPSAARARAAAGALAAARHPGGIAPGVGAVPFGNTPASWFTDQRRQLAGSFDAGTYVVFYTVGYADSRPREPVSSDRYADAEMTHLGSGVARAVLSVLGAPVPPPRCPGTPGC